MTIRNVVLVLVVAVAALAFSPVAEAGDRELWKHESGYFVKARGQNWIERGNGTEATTFHFVELRRTDEFVELYDKSRDITIRLRNRTSFIQQGKGERFTRLYDGTWMDKN